MTSATKQRKGKKGLAEYAEEQARARFVENQEIARANRVLRTEVAEQARELAELRDKLELYERVGDSKPVPPAWLTPERKAKKHQGTPCLLVTDVHWGEVVKPEQVDGVNCYHPRIAGLRLERVFTGAVRIARDYLAGLSYDGVQLFLGGDMISGAIHEELRETNQGTVAQSILAVAEAVIAGVGVLEDYFGRVNITAVVGNHGRTTRKPRAKERAQDNYDWLVYKLIERECGPRKGITVQVSDAADAHVQVYRTRYLLTHGDQFRGGSGISAALAPLLLGAHRKTRRQAAVGKPYDVMLMGHFHTSLMLPGKGIIVGGTTMGYDEYAYVSNLEPEPPQSAFWVTTPQHGVTFTAPVFASAGREAEGW